MIVLSERYQVRNVVKRWREQYAHVIKDPSKDVVYFVSGSNPLPTKSKLAILADLEKLNLESATADDVERVIGNDSWACEKTCSECGYRSWSCVALGRSEETAVVCLECLREAAAQCERERGGRA